MGSSSWYQSFQHISAFYASIQSNTRGYILASMDVLKNICWKEIHKR